MLGQQQVNAESCCKIGFVDTDYIIKHWDAVRELDNNLTQKKDGYERKIFALYNRRNQLLQELESDALDATTRSEKEQQLDNLDREIDKNEKQAEAELSEENEKNFKPLLAKLQKTIQQVAEREGYSYILSRKAGNEIMVLYMKDKADSLTLKILEELEKS
jgi:outer membrane protein